MAAPPSTEAVSFMGALGKLECCICLTPLADSPDDDSANTTISPSQQQLSSAICALPCGHLFHLGCITQMLDSPHNPFGDPSKKASCPMCRTVIPEWTPEEKHQRDDARRLLGLPTVGSGGDFGTAEDDFIGNVGRAARRTRRGARGRGRGRGGVNDEYEPLTAVKSQDKYKIHVLDWKKPQSLFTSPTGPLSPLAAATSALTTTNQMPLRYRQCLAYLESVSQSARNRRDAEKNLMSRVVELNGSLRNMEDTVALITLNNRIAQGLDAVAARRYEIDYLALEDGSFLRPQEIVIIYQKRAAALLDRRDLLQREYEALLLEQEELERREEEVNEKTLALRRHRGEQQTDDDATDDESQVHSSLKRGDFGSGDISQRVKHLAKCAATSGAYSAAGLASSSSNMLSESSHHSLPTQTAVPLSEPLRSIKVNSALFSGNSNAKLGPSSPRLVHSVDQANDSKTSAHCLDAEELSDDDNPDIVPLSARDVVVLPGGPNAFTDLSNNNDTPMLGAPTQRSGDTPPSTRGSQGEWRDTKRHRPETL